ESSGPAHPQRSRSFSRKDFVTGGTSPPRSDAKASSSSRWRRVSFVGVSTKNWISRSPRACERSDRRPLPLSRTTRPVCVASAAWLGASARGGGPPPPRPGRCRKGGVGAGGGGPPPVAPEGGGGRAPTGEEGAPGRPPRAPRLALPRQPQPHPLVDARRHLH